MKRLQQAILSKIQDCQITDNWRHITDNWRHITDNWLHITDNWFHPKMLQSVVEPVVHVFTLNYMGPYIPNVQWYDSQLQHMHVWTTVLAHRFSQAPVSNCAVVIQQRTLQYCLIGPNCRLAKRKEFKLCKFQACPMETQAETTHTDIHSTKTLRAGVGLHVPNHLGCPGFWIMKWVSI